MGRIFAIGDIHGCFPKVKYLLKRLPINWKTDILVFLGDYVDRGPESCQVLELMLTLNESYPGQIIFLKGNHEEMFLRYIEGDLPELYLSIGGGETLKSYPGEKQRPKIPDTHITFLKNLRLYYETDKYIFVHAGLRPGVPLENQSPSDLLWIRSEFVRSSYDWGKRIIFGHTPFSVPLVEENKIGIDTGAVYGGRLTALILPDLEFVFA